MAGGLCIECAAEAAGHDEVCRCHICRHLRAAEVVVGNRLVEELAHAI